MTAADKILPEAALRDVLDAHRRAGRRIVLTNGGFDLLHVGHVRALEEAAMLGGVLVVAVNDDPGVRAAKGSGRPVVPARERAETVAALQSVDYVTIFSDATVDHLLEVLRPAVHAKGRDYTPDTLPERATSRRLGIEVAIVGDEKLHSSTQLLTRAAGVREVQDRVLPLAVPHGKGFVLRRVRALLERNGYLALPRLVRTAEGALVQRHRTRSVRRLEVEGVPLYLKVNDPADRRRSPILEYQNLVALRAAGFRAPEPWLCMEGAVDGTAVGALLTREASGLALDEYLALALRQSGPQERAAMARGIGSTLRGLHIARFFHPDLHAWHVLVDGSATGGRRALTFLDVMRLERGGLSVRRRKAVEGLATLALTLREVVPPRFLLSILRAYLGGSLRASRPWIRAIEKRMRQLEHRGAWRNVGAERAARLRPVAEP
jgi:rfaE bifunctional protein nucleotidyltransferase chain/domain